MNILQRNKTHLRVQLLPLGGGGLPWLSWRASPGDGEQLSWSHTRELRTGGCLPRDRDWQNPSKLQLSLPA